MGEHKSKGKYNTGKPIDLKQLSKEEVKEAIHEWAEGSEALEKLLTEGYEKGFLSNSCCAGEMEDGQLPYVDYLLTDEYSRKMAIGIATKLANSDLDCEVDLGNNFIKNKYMPEKYPTKEIKRLTISSRMDNSEQVFNAMTKIMKEIEIENIRLPEDSSQIPWKKIKEPEQTEYDGKFVENLMDKLQENFGINPFEKNGVSDIDRQIENENAETQLTGEQLIDGVIELSEELDIRQGEIGQSEEEINRTEREYRQPEQEVYIKGNKRGE